jgi:preprotein translocase subunit SecE
MKNLIDYLQSLRNELTKVVWPKKKDVVRLTLIVLSISGIIGIYVGLLDFIFTKLLESLIVV